MQIKKVFKSHEKLKKNIRNIVEEYCRKPVSEL